MSKVLYRYYIEYSSYDGGTSIRLDEFPVIIETEKTYVIKVDGWRQKRVKKNAYSTYAYDTKEAAKDHFIRRTNNRIGWYEYWMGECKKGLDLIKELENE